MRPFALPLILALFISACGGGGGETAEEAPAAPEAPAVESTAMGTGSITGTISFDGAAPERSRLRMNADCDDQRDDPALSEDVVVNDGALQNAFVYVSAGLPDGYSYAAPSDPAVLDQIGCMYVPHVMGVHVGQTIRIENTDPFQHNIHPTPETNRGFNESTPNAESFLEKEFLIAEMGISVKCDVHAWMQAFVHVMDHPYHATSDAAGNFAISGLPAGDYTVTVRHESLGEQSMQVTVADDAASEANASFSAGA